MQEVIQNIALCDLMKYAKEQGLSTSDSRVYKTNRKYRYTLIRKEAIDVGFERNQPVCSVEYSKNSVPKYLAYTTQ